MMNAELKGIRADIEKMSSPENTVDSFYKDRGVDLMSVEVLTFKCSNPDTDKTLQEIIKETADRLKNIEKAKGENQVAMTKMQGEIELQGKNAELIKIKKSHMIIEQDIEGRAEAAKITAFVSALAHPALIPNPTGQGPRIAAHPEVDIKHATELFTINRKLDSLQTLAQGNATMYISHKDVNHIQEVNSITTSLSNQSNPSKPRSFSYLARQDLQINQSIGLRIIIHKSKDSQNTVYHNTVLPPLSLFDDDKRYNNLYSIRYANGANNQETIRFSRLERSEVSI